MFASVKGQAEYLLFQMEAPAGKREDGCGGKDKALPGGRRGT